MSTWFRRLSVLRSVALACVCVILVGCESKLTKANFDQIKVGMTMTEVEKLLGGPGTEDSSPQGMTINEAGVAGSSRASKDRIFIWKEEGATVTVVFQDGKVVERRQTGL